MIARPDWTAIAPDEVARELAALRAKYATMKALRAAHARDVAAGVAHTPSRDELRALATMYPGALAEIDRIAPTLLDARIDALAAIDDRSAREGDLPTWARGWIGVHRALRGALAIKAWLAGRRTIDAATSEAFDVACTTMRFADEARRWRDRLDLVASPPRGRLVDVVFEEVGAELAIDRAALRALLMPRP